MNLRVSRVSSFSEIFADTGVQDEGGIVKYILPLQAICGQFAHVRAVRAIWLKEPIVVGVYMFKWTLFERK